MRPTLSRFATLLSVVPFALAIACGSAGAAATVPDPKDNVPLASAPARDTAVFAGGCFWGIQAVFQHVKGVISATSGYAGGTVKSPDYETVSSGDTGHAESVEVIYDPSVVTYGQLLKVFFSVAHDPTELNRQGPDVGTQYRSAIFTLNDKQAQLAKNYIAQLTDAKVYKGKIVTVVQPLNGDFYTAEDYHQDYLNKHPTQPYIVYNDIPKVEALKSSLPDLYVSTSAATK
jgi:peptide-methionine (S)-S-oxide reductase